MVPRAQAKATFLGLTSVPGCSHKIINSSSRMNPNTTLEQVKRAGGFGAWEQSGSSEEQLRIAGGRCGKGQSGAWRLPSSISSITGIFQIFFLWPCYDNTEIVDSFSIFWINNVFHRAITYQWY